MAFAAVACIEMAEDVPTVTFRFVLGRPTVCACLYAYTHVYRYLRIHNHKGMPPPNVNAETFLASFMRGRYYFSDRRDGKSVVITEILC